MSRSKSRRHLRLKEWQPSLDVLQRPTADYLAACDGSLADAEFRLRTDANGYIVPSPLDDANFDETMVFFGDSFVESVYVSEERRFVAGVQSRLREAGVRTRCLNAGYSGATTLHLLMALLGKVGRSNKTTIVLVVPSNDALALAKKGGYWCMGDRRYTPVVPVPDGAESGSQPLNLVDNQAVLNLFVDACRRFRLELVLATFPHRTADFASDPWLMRRFGNATSYTKLLAGRDSINGVVRAVAKRLGLPFVDLDAMISTQTQLFYDDLHMNEAGSQRVAEILGDFMLARRAARVAG